MSKALVEKVARAIYESYTFLRPWDHPKAQEIHGDHTRRAARAAIACLRDPPRRVLKSAGGAMLPANRPTPEWVSSMEKHRIRFNAMIDEILK